MDRLENKTQSITKSQGTVWRDGEAKSQEQQSTVSLSDQSLLFIFIEKNFIYIQIMLPLLTS